MTTASTNPLSASLSMPAMMRRGPRYHDPKVRASRTHPNPRRQRAADALGVSCAVADKRLYGDAAVNLQCAAIVGADVRGGDLESALAFVAPIEAALGGAAIPLFQALHEAELADNAEQYADETFREKLRQGTATADDAREFIRKSAPARHKAEEAERAAQRWINHQEACG